MARRATIQLKVHGKIVQSIPLDQQDIECFCFQVSNTEPKCAFQRRGTMLSDAIPGKKNLDLMIDQALKGLIGLRELAAANCHLSLGRRRTA